MLWLCNLCPFQATTQRSLQGALADIREDLASTIVFSKHFFLHLFLKLNFKCRFWLNGFDTADNSHRRRLAESPSWGDLPGGKQKAQGYSDGLKQRWTVPFFRAPGRDSKKCWGLMGWSILKLPFQICFETNNCKQKQYSTNFIGLASLIHRISIAQTSRASQSHLPAFATWCRSLDSFETFETCNMFCKSSLFFSRFSGALPEPGLLKTAFKMCFRSAGSDRLHLATSDCLDDVQEQPWQWVVCDLGGVSPGQNSLVFHRSLILSPRLEVESGENRVESGTHDEMLWNDLQCRIGRMQSSHQLQLCRWNGEVNSVVVTMW